MIFYNLKGIAKHIFSFWNNHEMIFSEAENVIGKPDPTTTLLKKNIRTFHLKKEKEDALPDSPK